MKIHLIHTFIVCGMQPKSNIISNNIISVLVVILKDLIHCFREYYYLKFISSCVLNIAKGHCFRE